MTNKEAVEILAGKYQVCIYGDQEECDRTNEALDMAIKALSSSEIPNSSETIYRQDAIRILDAAWVDGTEYQGYLHDRFEKLPPADVQPVVHGKWIFNPDGMDWNIPAWVCSECHGKNDMIPTYIQGKDKMIKVEHPLRWAGSKYCPNCGAKMDGKGADNV